MEKALASDNSNLYFNKAAFDKLVTICLESLTGTGRSGFVTKTRTFPLKNFVYFGKIQDYFLANGEHHFSVINMVI